MRVCVGDVDNMRTSDSGVCSTILLRGTGSHSRYATLESLTGLPSLSVYAHPVLLPPLVFKSRKAVANLRAVSEYSPMSAASRPLPD